MALPRDPVFDDTLPNYLLVPTEMPPMVAVTGDLTDLLVSYGLAVDGSGYQVETRAWYAEVKAAGGVVSTAEIQAVDNFIVTLLSAGIWPLLYRVGLTVGDGLTAVSVPILRVLGSTVDAYSNINEANYSRATGIGFGFMRSIVTGINPSAQLSPGNLSLSVYTKGVTDGYLIGSTVLSPNRIASRLILNNSRRYYPANGTTSIAGAGTVIDGLYTGTRNVNSVTAYYNGVSDATGTATTSSLSGAVDLTIGVPTVGPLSGYYRAYAVGQHLPASQAAALSTAFATLATALGW